MGAEAADTSPVFQHQAACQPNRPHLQAPNDPTHIPRGHSAAPGTQHARTPQPGTPHACTLQPGTPACMHAHRNRAPRMHACMHTATGHSACMQCGHTAAGQPGAPQTLRRRSSRYSSWSSFRCSTIWLPRPSGGLTVSRVMVKLPPAWLSQMYCSSSLCFVTTCAGRGAHAAGQLHVMHAD